MVMAFPKPPPVKTQLPSWEGTQAGITPDVNSQGSCPPLPTPGLTKEQHGGFPKLVLWKRQLPQLQRLTSLVPDFMLADTQEAERNLHSAGAEAGGT